MTVNFWSNRVGVVRIFSTVAAAAAMLACGGSVAAAIVVSDTWLDTTRNSPGPAAYSEFANDQDSDGNIESAWFNSGGTMSVVAPGGGAPVNGSNNIMRVAVNTTPAGGSNTGNDSFETYFTQPGGAVTLANPGDFIKVTWTFTPTGINNSNTGQSLPIALVNTNGVARLTADNNSPASGAYQGYAMFTNMKTGNLGNGNSFELRERGTTNGAFLSTGSEWLSYPTKVNGATTATPGYTEGAEYTFVMSLTLNASAGLDIAASMSGSGIGGAGNQISIAFTDTTPNSLSYNMFGLAPASGANTAAQFDTSFFQVETNTAVPEISSFLMVGLVGAGGLAIRRLRRQKSVEPILPA